MINIHEEENQVVKAILVGAYDRGAVPLQNAAAEVKSDPLYELRGLVKTLGMECAETVILTNSDPSPRFGIGSGKAAEIAAIAEELEADCIIFDFEISPTHQRNWEKLASIPVFDRHEVIIRIFASRARTKEAVMQVELAQLEYSLPRLAHSYGDMARQRGGSYGSKGAGETKLELDRRAVQTKMAKIKKDLQKVVKERETLRKRRDKIPLPTCALVGYTNAGKSSLLNALTGADVFVEDKLFATLDPTTRRYSLPGGTGVLITDTVGFISNLPHSLVDAFKSTLEEAARAELLLIVLDATDPGAEQQFATVQEVLGEIGADSNNSLILLNKTDNVTDQVLLARLRQLFPDAIETSAKTKAGFEKVAESICERLLGSEKTYLIPLDKQELAATVRRTGNVTNEVWQEDGILLTARATGKTRNLLEPYII